MKALSVKQPWASLIASGQKGYETRTRPCRYKGTLLICSSKKPDLTIGDDPPGHALAVCWMVGCRPMVKSDEKAACCEIYDGAYVWILTNVKKLPIPFPVKGQLGLYTVSDEKVIASVGRETWNTWGM